MLVDRAAPVNALALAGARAPPAPVAQTRGCEEHVRHPSDLRRARPGRAPRAKKGRSGSRCASRPATRSARSAPWSAAVRPLLDPAGTGLVDELLVVDDGSSDETAGRARAAGARVVPGAPAATRRPPCAAGLEATTGDIVVFLDADVENTTDALRAAPGRPAPGRDDRPREGLLRPAPRRPAPTGGGRVTELVARPIIELLFPELTEVRQPLAGETAAHRWVLEKLSFADGYGVEIGLLVDVARRLRHRVDRPGRPRRARPPQPAPRRAAPPGPRRPADRPGETGRCPRPAL